MFSWVYWPIIYFLLWSFSSSSSHFSFVSFFLLISGISYMFWIYAVNFLLSLCNLHFYTPNDTFDKQKFLILMEVSLIILSFIICTFVFYLENSFLHWYQTFSCFSSKSFEVFLCTLNSLIYLELIVAIGVR